MSIPLDCLYTTVKNISGKSRVFPFLREHGVRLDNNETVTIPGNVIDVLATNLYKRDFKALERSLNRGSLDIVKTPGVFLYDEITEETKQLILSNETLGTTDPCWYSDTSSSSSA